MKSSLIKVLVFVGILLAIGLWLHNFLDAQMKKLKYEDASVWNQITQGGIDADIIVIGSSRAATHIDPTLISKASDSSCYNLGMMGHNFYIENARYYYYLQHNKAPKTIILSLDYESLQRRPDLFNHTQFLAYLDDSILAKATKQYEGFSKYDYSLPLLKYVGEQSLIFSLVNNYFNPQRNQPDRTNGFFARDVKWSIEVDQTLDTMKPYVVQPDSLSLAAFETFLNDTKEQNIKLVFVHTPTHPLGQEKVVNRNEIIDLYRKYARQYQILFLDYATDTMCLNRAYFMNSTHLNKYGARVFTQKLITDLFNKNWISPRDSAKK